MEVYWDQWLNGTLEKIPEDLHKGVTRGLFLEEENIAKYTREKGSLWEYIVSIKVVSESAKTHTERKL